MSVDPKLGAIARMAEAGEPCPMLRLVSGPMFVLGTPVRSDRFEEAADEAVAREMQARAQNYRRKDRDEAYRTLLDGVQPTLDAASVAPEPQDPVALTMVEAVVWAWGESSGQRVPVVRVRLDSVSAWWVGEAEQIKGQTGSGGWFYGISVPLGN